MHSSRFDWFLGDRVGGLISEKIVIEWQLYFSERLAAAALVRERTESNADSRRTVIAIVTCTYKQIHDSPKFTFPYS